MKAEGIATALLVLGAVLGIPSATAQEGDPGYDDRGVSWGIGRLSIQNDFSTRGETSIGRSEVSLAHLEYRLTDTPVVFQTEVLNFAGKARPDKDGGYLVSYRPSLPPVTLWWAPALPAFPAIQGGPFLGTGGTLNLVETQDSDYQVVLGLKARISMRIKEFGGFRPFFDVYTGINQDQRIVLGGSMELGTLAGLLLSLAALSQMSQEED